jgi:UDP-GlcNAc:undecaprenyl-phosphate/decaprenyl-phosphate GlcNAc-1-phosphate transferase
MSFNLSNEFFFLFFLFSIIFSFSIVRISKKIFKGQLLDKDFSKPQAFHHQATARVGGLIFFFLFLIFIFIFFKIYDYFLIDYFIIASSFFILGFLDDLKVKISPNYRLIIMLMILVFSINIFSIEINRTGLAFLNSWLENNIFQLCFVLLCFLFIINGSNLIDGFNGLLISHFIIITLIYYIINLSSQNINFSNILLIQVVIAVSIFFFNFPKAKIFLGDSGSYLIGSLIALNTIKTYELNFLISSFFFAAILVYLFYEVFFSFIRKAISRRSPLKPDNKHLHMLLFNWLVKKKKIKNSNHKTSIVINLSYLVLILPLQFFKNDGLFCRYWFFLLIILYSFVYFRLYSFSKK